MFGYGPPSHFPLPHHTQLTFVSSQDLGGQTSIRPYWRCYYANTAAVIFVVDSTDIERLQTAADELSAMLNEDELKDAALLVFANKQDQPGAKGAGDISEALRLGELRDRNWSIMACSAVDGSGVNEGMDWLVVSLLSQYFCLRAGLTPPANRQPGVVSRARLDECTTAGRRRRSVAAGTSSLMGHQVGRGRPRQTLTTYLIPTAEEGSGPPEKAPLSPRVMFYDAWRTRGRARRLS
jgi:hypothetical protein